MKNKNLKNSTLSFILIISTLLMPFTFYPHKAEAQISNGYSVGFSGYYSGLASAIARLPQCQKEINNKVRGLFNGISGLVDGIGGDLGDATLPAKGLETGSSLKDMVPTSLSPVSVPSLDDLSSSATFQATTPAVSDTEVKRLLEKTNKNLEQILGKTEAINANSSCIQSIGRLVTKMLLQKLTLSTVNWINSGFDGKPAFVQNPGKFFGDIAKNEILQFGAEINNPELFPFGKAWLQNTATAFNNKFQDNAQYSLNELIQETTPEYSAETFQQDFAHGGWNAWSALTQVPANNPLGFKIMADNEIQRRLAGTSMSTAQYTQQALQAANGFLGDNRCIGYAGRDLGVTRQERTAALAAGKKDPCLEMDGNWEYVTPGKLISQAATNAINYQNNAYLNVEDLNDAIAAITDAVLNRFSSNLMEKGFANMDYQGIDGVLTFNDAGANYDYRTQSEKDFMQSQLGSSWLQANPDFNIRTDLTQALIDEQRTYSDKLAQENKELMSTTDGLAYGPRVCPPEWTGTYPNCTAPIKTEFSVIGNPTFIPALQTCPSGWTGTYPNCVGPGTYNGGVSNAYGLMPVIYQLDYCIPGPHPGWENDSREALNNISVPQRDISPNQVNQVTNGVIGAGLNFVPYVGPVLSSLFSVFSGESEAAKLSTKIRQYYTNKFYDFTGYKPQAPRGAFDSTEPRHINMTTPEGLSSVLNRILDRYINIMDKTYFSSPDILPPIASEAAKEFNKLPGYNQMIKDNKNKILSMKTTVSILNDIKAAVDKLNLQLESGEISNDQYEESIKTQINEFGRVSADMVTGDDIAQVNDVINQIIAKKNYIYKNLLKGPYGCEAFLENPANVKSFPSAGKGVKIADNDWSNYDINSVKRMTYPFPIIYDYNNFTNGQILPDPWNSGYKESELPKMPTENKDTSYGPGFLSFVFFGATFAGDNNNNYNGDERLQLGDLVDDYDPESEAGDHWHDWVSLGKYTGPRLDGISPGIHNGKEYRSPGGDGLFEKTIGIY